MTAAVATAVIAEPVGRVNARLLDRELTAKFASVDHCRTDVARRKRVAPALITVDSLKLRWTIAGKGQVAAMDVVGSTPMDADVLDCINRDTNGWLFTLSRRRRCAAQSCAGLSPLVPAGAPSLSAALRAPRLDWVDLGARGGREPGKMSWRAASQMATTAGCLILRSTEMA